MEKKCNKCLKIMNAFENFYKDRRVKGGYRTICKICSGCIKVPPVSKICSVCLLEKKYTDFSLRNDKCRDCYRSFSLEKKKEQNKMTYSKNIEYVVPDFKFCNKCGVETPINEFPVRKDSKDNHRNECFVCFIPERKLRSKSYKKKNRKSLQEKDMAYRKERMKNDPFYRAKIDARNIVRKALREKGYSKKSKTEQILGCSFIEFKSHIESLFLTNMSWENRSEWHIDHIVPLDFALNEKEIIELNNFSNLRPLWISDNLEKSNVITEKTEIYYRILSNRG